MSGREWVPGDVASIHGTIVLAHSRMPGLFTYADGSEGRDHDGDARPLVVIDPEDREQVERLTRALPEDWALLEFDEAEHSLRAVAQALREFAKPTPPKPLVDKHSVADLLRQVAIDREVPYWRDDHPDLLDAAETYLRSLADHLGVTP